MNTQTRTFNLAPVFVVWSAIFVIAAFDNDNMGLLWWAAAPWLFLLTFILIIFLFVGTVMWSKYRQGERIEFETRKGVRYVQRGRKGQRVVRNTAGRR